MMISNPPFAKIRRLFQVFSVFFCFVFFNRKIDFYIKNRFCGQKKIIQKNHNFLSFRHRKFDFGCLKWFRMIPGTKKQIDVFFNFSIKIHVKPICSPKMTILTLFELLKLIKTDRKSIVVSGSLDITSGSRLK